MKPRGSIVRINPWELHIRDPEWNEVYKPSRKSSKSMWYYRTLSTPGNTFTSESHEVHHLRRTAIQSFFSATSVTHYQEQVEKLIFKLCSRMRDIQGQHRTADLSDVFRCLASDVATEFVFGKTFGYLDHPDFEHDRNNAIKKFGTLGMMDRQLRGWLFVAIKAVPPWLARTIMTSSSFALRNFTSVSIFQER